MILVNFPKIHRLEQFKTVQSNNWKSRKLTPIKSDSYFDREFTRKKIMGRWFRLADGTGHRLADGIGHRFSSVEATDFFGKGFFFGRV